MGGGTYSSTTRTVRADSMGYTTKSVGEIFTQRSINNAMSPYDLGARESKDSAEHPNSYAISIALDVTGSMGSVPHFLVKDGLPNIMQSIIDAGVPDPQLLFMGIGDHVFDQAPVQIGQFESSDELLDKWLTDLWLEGGGGNNNGESYLLAWYVAAMHTNIDCFNNRSQKGVLFTIGDEPVLESIPVRELQNIFGAGQYKEYSAAKLFEMAKEKYHVYHIHIRSTGSGRRQSVMDGWIQLLRDNCLIAQNQEMVAEIISSTVLKHYGEVRGSIGVVPQIPEDAGESKTEEIIL